MNKLIEQELSKIPQEIKDKYSLEVCGKRNNRICIHNPAFVAFPINGMTVEVDDVTCTLTTKKLILNMWVSSIIIHVSIL